MAQRDQGVLVYPIVVMPVWMVADGGGDGGQAEEKC
jgi:hypothetical protein